PVRRADGRRGGAHRLPRDATGPRGEARRRALLAAPYGRAGRGRLIRTAFLRLSQQPTKRSDTSPAGEGAGVSFFDSVTIASIIMPARRRRACGVIGNRFAAKRCIPAVGRHSRCGLLATPRSLRALFTIWSSLIFAVKR